MASRTDSPNLAKSAQRVTLSALDDSIQDGGSQLATSLQTRFIFGCNTDVNNNGSFTNDDTIAYVAGHDCAVIQLTRDSDFCSPGHQRRDHCVHERPWKEARGSCRKREKPQVHVFDLRTFRRKKTLLCKKALLKNLYLLSLVQMTN